MSENLIRILLVEDNPGDARLLEEMLVDAGADTTEMVHVGDLAAAMNLLAIEAFDVTLLDLGLPDSNGLATFEKFYAKHANVPVVVLSGLDDEGVAISAVDSGAQDYLPKGRLDAETLMRAIRYAISRHAAQTRAICDVSSGPETRVLAFIGAKGGVGTTTVALNVASALVHGGGSAAVVELRSYVGAFATQLGVEPVHTLNDLSELGPAGITPEALRLRLFTLPSGLRVLFGPQDSISDEPIDPDVASMVVEVLMDMFDHVVLDLPAEPSEASRRALLHAWRVVMVSESEPTSLCAGRAILDMLRGWSVTGQLVGAIVVNRVAMPMGINQEEMRGNLGCPIVGVVPPAPEDCAQAVRAGRPLVLSHPGTAVATRLSEIADQITADTVTLSVA